jgi:hypothetical protein
MHPISTARRALCYERAAARRDAVQLGEQVRRIGESHPGRSVLSMMFLIDAARGLSWSGPVRGSA